PESIRTRLVEGDTSVLASLNQIYQAKEEVRKARGNLLPGLGLSVTAGGRPNFALSAVNVLLPFLLPSNWHALEASKHQLAANGYAYHLVALNDYAAALSLYTQVMGDVALRSVYRKQYENLKSVEEIVEDQVVLGTATRADLAQARAQVQLAQVQISQVDELIAREKSSIRRMLGLSLETELEMTTNHFPRIDEEKLSPRKLYDRIHDTSPEQRQIESLLEAAKSAKFTTVWGFMSGASMNVSTNFGGSASFGNLTQTASVNLGFGLFPAIQISNLNIAALKIRRTEISLEQASVIESALASVAEAREQVSYASQARDNYDIAFNAELDKFRIGQTDLLNVFVVSNNATAASASYVRSLADLDTQRVTLNRVLLRDQFAKIPTCRLGGAEKSGGIFGFLKGIFGSKKKRYASID
ncbi:MAG: TolC family protein, partial [Proteobacteria bacterium]